MFNSINYKLIVKNNYNNTTYTASKLIAFVFLFTVINIHKQLPIDIQKAFSACIGF